jgi:hypothetical protein
MMVTYPIQLLGFVFEEGCSLCQQLEVLADGFTGGELRLKAGDTSTTMLPVKKREPNVE